MIPKNSQRSVIERINGDIVNVDEDTATKYYQWENRLGHWLIMKETTSSGDQAYTYATGTSGASTNWTNRASLTYYAPSALTF